MRAKNEIRDELFASEYVANGGNGTKALLAIAPAMSEKVARTTAARMLAKVGVQGLVETRLRALCKKAEIDAARVLTELHHIAMADVGELLDESGCVRRMNAIPVSLRRAISGIDVEEIWMGKGENRTQIGVIKKIRFWNKVGALDLIGKNLELWVEKVKLVDNNPHSAHDLNVMIEMLTRLRDAQRAAEEAQAKA